MEYIKKKSIPAYMLISKRGFLECEMLQKKSRRTRTGGNWLLVFETR